MCSPAPARPPPNIGSYWSDEKIIKSLEGMTKGSSIPENVTADVNPYQHMPSHLPDDIWYFLHSERNKYSEHGHWKARGVACEIFIDSVITGWRTTLDFYEGLAPHGRRTNWVMQEYRITHKGLSSNINPKESSLLCRVFFSSGASSNQEMQHELSGAEVAGGNHFRPEQSLVPDGGSANGQGCMSESQARNRDDDDIGPLAAAGGLPNIYVENGLDINHILRDDYLELDDLVDRDINHILRDDYLELDDLVDRESRSSSSDNTSCLTLTSDECFDALALLRDLEDDANRGEQQKDANLKFSVAPSFRPNEVVMHPGSLETFIGSHGSQSAAEVIDQKFMGKRDPKNAIKNQKVDAANEGTSNEGEKKAVVGRIKWLKKKYMCFMPF
ncbi:hypothetical protein U1Q18_005784 [Sarracenia purpurea var. burkii]